MKKVIEKNEFRRGDTTPISLRLPSTLLKRIDVLSREKGYKRSELIVMLLAETLGMGGQKIRTRKLGNI